MAGGTDSPVGLSIPKQLIPVAGRPIMERSIELVQIPPHVGGTGSMMTPGRRVAAGVLLRPGRTIPAPPEGRHPRGPVRISPLAVAPAHDPAV